MRRLRQSFPFSRGWPVLVALFVLAATSLAHRDPRQEEFELPAIDFSQRSVDEWLSVLHDDTKESGQALWSLYYWDERTPRVIDALKQLLQRKRARFNDSEWSPRDHRLLRDLDAVLDDWGTEHECLNLEEYLGEWAAREVVAFPWDVIDLDWTEARLRAGLESFDLDEIIRAVLTAIAQGHSVSTGIQVLVHELQASDVTWDGPFWSFAEDYDPSAPDSELIRGFRWAWEFAGIEAERGLAELLADPSVPNELKRFLLDDIGLRSMPEQRLRSPRLLPNVLADLAREGPLAESARRELFRICDVEISVWEDPFDDEGCHTWRRPLENPELAETLARCVEDLLSAPYWESFPTTNTVMAWLEQIFGWEVEPLETTLQDLNRLAVISRAVLRSEAVREVARPWLYEQLDEGGDLGEQALRLLCHTGDTGPTVREAYLSLMEVLQGLWRYSIQLTPNRVPCLQHHDEETSNALRQLLAEQPRPRNYLNQMLEGDLLGAASAGPDHDDYLEILQLHGRDSDWSKIYRSGFSEVVEYRFYDSESTRLSKLGIRARRKRLLGESVAEETKEVWANLEEGHPRRRVSTVSPFTTSMQMICELDLGSERFPDWALQLMTQPDAAALRSHSRLAAGLLKDMTLTRRQQALLCRVDPKLLGEAWGPLLGRQGPAAIERAADVRVRFYAGDAHQLRTLLGMTRLSRLDLRVLRRLLRKGSAQDRQGLLELVGEFGLESPELADSVRHLRDDCDDVVSERARSLCEERGW